MAQVLLMGWIFFLRTTAKSLGFVGIPLSLALALLLLIGAPSSSAQQLFKYQDANGVWVFTDRQPAAAQAYEARTLQRSFELPEVRVFQRPGSLDVALIAQNTYYAPVQLAYRLTKRQNVADGAPRDGITMLPPRSETQLLAVGKAVSRADLSFEYDFKFLPGDPAAEHRPVEPYRLPYALASAARVSQAYPDTVTHTDPSSYHAIDFVLPVGTQVFAARDGIVIEVASDFYESGTNARVDGPRANLVRVLHDDGTMALYGHLNWNSIRVRPGQRVQRGEYVADSGNTGFTTGPHLHFAVQRNRGGSIESVPAEFAGAAGTAITLVTGEAYTAR